MKDRIFNSLTLLCTVLLLTTLSGYAQSFSVQTVNLTAQQLVDSMLKGEGVSITNAQFNRSTGVVGNNIGIFHNLNLYSSSDFYQRSAVNWPLGIIMTTGAISAATGGDIGTSNKVPTDAAVDPDLVPLTPNPVKSLTLLEFDFIANSASIKFEYIFASKEYPNYVYQSFNDIFAFHITGRNPVTFANNWKTNIALVPNSIPPLPVTVGNGNNGNSGGGGNASTVAPSASNPQYFFDNRSSAFTSSIKYGGFTVDLMAQTVIYPCFGLYHMSLSIADVTDNILQSAVFLKKGSFSSPQITSERTSALGSSNDTIMDFCNPAYIKLKLSEPNLTAVNFVTLDLGAAANADAIWGTDYRVYNTTTGAEMQSGEEISFNTGVADYGPDGIPIITGSDTVRELRIEAIPGALQPGEVKTAKIRTAITTTGTASVCLNVVKRDTVTIILKGYVKLELGEDTVINICNQFNDALDIPLKKGWLKSVTWQGDHIGYLNFNSADSLTATLTSPITDTANFTIIAEDRYGCSRDTAHIRINIPPRPTVEIQTNVPAGCTPFKFSPSAIFTPSYATLHWQTDEGETSAIKNPTFTITQDGKVWLYAYTDYYCYDSTFVPIDVFERPSADFTYLPLEPLNGRPIEFYNASTGDISDFRWNFGDGTTSTEINPIHTYHVNNSELFNVRLITIAGAVENCADTTMQQLLVEDHYAYYVPTGFSPNGDGINDEFTPTLMDAFDYTFAVYNRWGSLVFFSNEIGSGWDGNDKNGNECENGVYVWKISFKKYTDPNALLEHKGMVTLVR